MTPDIYSYHIFSFPFKWELPGASSFAGKTDLKKIVLPGSSLWKNLPNPVLDQYDTELYNEKNYFYQFVHSTLYDEAGDDPIIKHFERDECYMGEVSYHIKIQDEKTYRLNVKSISLNLYTTGVGVLSFYLENYNSRSLDDVLMINQYGRRIYPPFLATGSGVKVTKEKLLADAISIEGLVGGPKTFYDDFEDYTSKNAWRPGDFIVNLLSDFKESWNWVIAPVFDDRMFVSCWVGNDKLARLYSNLPEFYKTSEDWYILTFLDKPKDLTCQNKELLSKFLTNCTLPRWQRYGTLYGITRYSMIALTDEGEFAKTKLLTDLRTIYYRMAELCIVQRASILKFSDEVSEISSLSNPRTSRLSDDVSSLYLEYIKFTNRVYYREVTGQEQGMESYSKLQEVMGLKDHVKDLDGEIEELHQYVAMLEENDRNRNLSILTVAATSILLPSFIVGYFGISLFDRHKSLEWGDLALINLMMLLSGGLVFWLIRAKTALLRIVVLVMLLVLLLITFLWLPQRLVLYEKPVPQSEHNEF